MRDEYNWLEFHCEYAAQLVARNETHINREHLQETVFFFSQLVCVAVYLQLFSS